MMIYDYHFFLNVCFGCSPVGCSALLFSPRFLAHPATGESLLVSQGGRDPHNVASPSEDGKKVCISDGCKVCRPHFWMGTNWQLPGIEAGVQIAGFAFLALNKTQLVGQRTAANGHGPGR